MSDSRWVQHKSGEGKKWPIHHEAGPTWWSWEKTDDCKYAIYLPKSEYNLCEPPEQWVDVTATCDIDTDYSLLDHPEEGGHGWRIFAPAGLCIGQYRLRKVELWTLNKLNHIDHSQWAFIVERRAP